MKTLSVLDRKGQPIVVCDTSVADADGINAGWYAYFIAPLHPPQIAWYGTLECRVVNQEVEIP